MSKPIDVRPQDLENFESDTSKIKEMWGEKTCHGIRQDVPGREIHEVSGRKISTYTLQPFEPDYEPGDVIVRIAETGQSIEPLQQYIGARSTQLIVAPDKPMVMFQHNGFARTEHEFGPKLMTGLNKKGLTPYAEDIARVLEQMRVRRASITGWSLGARLAIEVGALNPDFEIVAINSDEPASKKDRDSKQLTKDNLKSGSFSGQRQAGEDSGIPAIKENFGIVRLGIDYLKFGLLTVFDKKTKAMITAMSGDIYPVIEKLHQLNPNTKLKLGRVADSYVYEPGPFDAQHPNTSLEIYQDFPKQGHLIVNNPVLQAALVKRGLKTNS